MRTSAGEIGRSFDCHTPNCTGGARSNVGRYAYCDMCRERRASEVPVAAAPAAAKRSDAEATTFIGALSSLQSLAKQVDKQRAKAKKATETALAAKRAADKLEGQLRDAVRDLGTAA